MTERLEVGLRIRGRVQGVGFRAWAARRAQERGLAGWVRNCRDGSVEVRVGGPAAAVAEYLRLLEQGPPLARVDALERVQLPAEPPPAGFDIR